VCRIWKGAGDDARIFVSTSSDGVVWSDQRLISGLTSHHPAVCTGPGPVHVGPPGSFPTGGTALHRVWKGEFADARMFGSLSEDGVNWTPEHQIPGLTSHSPAIALSGSTLRRIWKGEFADSRMFISSAADPSGKNWTPEQQIPGLTSHGPALAGDGGGNGLYRLWKGVGDDARTFFSSSQDGGTNWTPQRPVPGLSSHGPALASGGEGRLYRLWKGIGDDARMFFSSSQDGGATWTQEEQVQGLTSHGPALAVQVREIIN
jgi:hypothetical protein